MWDAGGSRGPSNFVLPSGWVTRVGTAETLDRLQDVTEDLAASIGFSRVTYSQHLPTAPTTIPLFFTTYPQPWIEHYSAHDLSQIDPVIRLAKVGRPFGWRDIPDRVQGSGRHVLHEARDFGIMDGYCVPILGGAVMGAMNALPQGSPRDRNEVLRYGTESLIALAHLVHERARFLSLRDTRKVVATLSPMESEMVQRLMGGGDDDQVIAGMRLGDGDYHRLLRSVMTKLGAHDTNQLRARTALLGLGPA